MQSKTLVELKDVKRYYELDEGNFVKAVNGVSIKINKGEFVTIFGPSGCGKSTLMHLIGLLDRPTKGSVLIEGNDVAKLNSKEITNLRSNTIGFIFQAFLLTPNLTALENVEFPMVLVEKDEKYRYKRAKELLEQMNLSERLNHLPYQLSGGQKQRVAIARALANEPTLILADEPTGNSDSKTGKEVIELFMELWKKGNTIVVVTHDQNLAKLAPRTIEMLDGKIISDKRNNKKGGE